VLTLIDGAGGEMRVELVLIAKAKSNGDVLVDGTAVLYEGTSEQTDERDGDGDETFQVLVPRDSITSQTIRVRNEDEGDDFADTQMTFKPTRPCDARGARHRRGSGALDCNQHRGTRLAAHGRPSVDFGCARSLNAAAASSFH
jgi:hypothetical protein